MKDDLASILDREQLGKVCERYGFHPPKTQLDEAAVPPKLQFLIPYAEIWGHPDSDIRYEVIGEMPLELRNHVIRIVLADDVSGTMSDWLGGDETRDSYETPEYLGLSYLGQAAEEFEILNDA